MGCHLSVGLSPRHRLRGFLQHFPISHRKSTSFNRGDGEQLHRHGKVCVSLRSGIRARGPWLVFLTVSYWTWSLRVGVPRSPVCLQLPWDWWWILSGHSAPGKLIQALGLRVWSCPSCASSGKSGPLEWKTRERPWVRPRTCSAKPCAGAGTGSQGPSLP